MTEMKQYLAVEDMGKHGLHRLVFSSDNLQDAIEFAEMNCAEFCGEITESYVVREKDLLTDRHHAWKVANGLA